MAKRKKKKISKKILHAREKRAAKRHARELLEEFKLKVIERDNFTCQLCNKDLKPETERKSRHVHHIISNIKKFESLRCDINNGILLCPRCHIWAYNSPHLNSMYFTIWLSTHKKEQYNYLYNKLIELGYFNN